MDNENANGQTTQGEDKPKRTRRTKAQMEADSAAAATAETGPDTQVDTPAPTVESQDNVPGPVTDIEGRDGIQLTTGSENISLTFNEEGEMVEKDSAGPVGAKPMSDEVFQDKVDKFRGFTEAEKESIAQNLTSEDVMAIKKGTAGLIVKAIRMSPEATVLTCPHKLAVHIINYPGVFFDPDKKILTYEGQNVQLVIDDNVENLDLK